MDGKAGATKISLSLSKPQRDKFTNTKTNGLKRPHNLILGNDDEEGIDELRDQQISHVSRENTKAKSDAPLVIARQANRDWREAAQVHKRQKSLLPVAEQGGLDADTAEKEAEARRPGFGLTVRQKSAECVTKDGKVTNGEDVANGDQTVQRKTLDQRALDALLGNGDSHLDRSLIVSQADAETTAFKHDFHDAPDMASPEAYARIPVEQFGAAMLRGMGWKDSGKDQGSNGKTGTNKNPHKFDSSLGRKPRSAHEFLGIGAKSEAAVTNELGVWGKAAGKGSGYKEPEIFQPLRYRNKKTGETFASEEDMIKAREQKAREEFEREFDRREREKERSKGRDMDRDGEKGTEGGRDRERNRDEGRERREEDGEEEEYQRRDRERRRRKERDRDAEHDRYRDRARDHGHLDSARRHREGNNRDGDDYHGSSRRRHRDGHERDDHRDRDRDRDRYRERDRHQR